jgi:hypothetical protein
MHTLTAEVGRSLMLQMEAAELAGADAPAIRASPPIDIPLFKRVKPMRFLKSARALECSTLLAVDGEIGSLEDLYFEDLTWRIRYLAVNSRGGLIGRHVLISPVAIGDVQDDEKRVHIELTRAQILSSPSIERQKPVSRQYEVEYFKYYAWPPYWDTGSVSGVPLTHRALTPPALTAKAGKPGREETQLRCATEIKGYAVAARDRVIGYVEDFIIDLQYWAIRYLQIDSRNCWPGKHVLLNPGWIEGVSWRERTVNIDLTGDAIKSAPGFDPSGVISRDYEVRLFRHYGRRVYWQQDNQAT